MPSDLVTDAGQMMETQDQRKLTSRIGKGLTSKANQQQISKQIGASRLRNTVAPYNSNTKPRSPIKKSGTIMSGQNVVGVPNHDIVDRIDDLSSIQDVNMTADAPYYNDTSTNRGAVTISTQSQKVKSTISKMPSNL